MPIEAAQSVEIACDNPACPGLPKDSPLKPDDRAGWLLVTSEVYGEPVTQHVFCSYACAAVVAGYKATEEAPDAA